jgi:hypothetical protein
MTMTALTNRSLLLFPAVAALALGASACSSSNSTVTTPTTPVTSYTETYTGSIDRGGSAVHPFAIKSGGYTLLAGYTTITPSSVTALGMGVGSWDGTTSTCGLNQTQNDSARAASTGLTATAAAGNFCIRVYDGGNIPEGVTASYTLKVEHY